MIDYLTLSFAFTAGIASFFSPCAVFLLPGLITYYLSQKSKLWAGFMLGIYAVFGFFVVFGLTGFLVIYIGQVIKSFIPALTIITGLIVTVLGASMLLGKDLFVRIPQIKGKSPVLFGVFYAIAALGCTFPLFLTIILQGINENSLFGGLLTLFAYILGMSILMISTTVLTVLFRESVKKYIRKIIPYIHRISGIIIFGAGIYMVYIGFLT